MASLLEQIAPPDAGFLAKTARGTMQAVHCKIGLVERTIGAARGRAARGRPRNG